MKDLLMPLEDAAEKTPERQIGVGLIEALDHEARGIARAKGKVIFVEDALPGERVEYESFCVKPRYEQARLRALLSSSFQRVAARCPHFGVCGGCVMQHLDATAQVAVKARILEDTLWHVGRVRAETPLTPIHGPAWGYRHRARLGARFVRNAVLLGFRARKSSYIADVRVCPVLHPLAARLLAPLRELIGGLSVRDRLPQVEIAVGEERAALVLRILKPASAADKMAIRAFAQTWDTLLYLQKGGPESATLFHPEPPLEKNQELAYLLPEQNLRMTFCPTDFTQANHSMNRALIRRALTLLELSPQDRVVDLFCGLGNFTLPIAKTLAGQGAKILGIEGNPALTGRARENARAHQLEGRAEFLSRDLFTVTPDFWRELTLGFGRANKLILDPPREGALKVVKSLPPETRPERIVYVSCNPATLARDAAILTSQKGYALKAAGIMNMFPHTAHVESIALFTA
ncbi:MAG: 23S rRNA (uracil(1939)-C(5))-methyltransferase RlmD [Zoogloeaceae bacterium]|jgi:23S rRNA (uracil1939-C5)-methyltransferase|nr:23S rRNA (uracil(1939)-C(5))-methyltransferase RlmD [Zoogloeaceae bacterium]